MLARCILCLSYLQVPEPEDIPCRFQGDQEYITKAHLLNEIKVSMGENCREDHIWQFDHGCFTGYQDGQRLCKIHGYEVWNVQNLGFINYESDDQEEVFLGKNLGHTKPYSEKIAAAIDEEVKQIVDECYREAYEILEQNVDVLHKSAKLLLEKERITELSLKHCSIEMMLRMQMQMFRATVQSRVQQRM